jgi:hypothetical protein
MEAGPRSLAALRAIVARIDGVWDQPDLVAFGTLHPNTMADVRTIACSAIAAAEAVDE